MSTVCNEKNKLRRLQPFEKQEEKTFFPLFSHSGGTGIFSAVLWKQYFRNQKFLTSRFHRLGLIITIVVVVVVVFFFNILVYHWSDEHLL